MSVQFPDTVFKVSADLASGAQTAQSLVQQALARACDPTGQGATTLLTLHRDDALLAARASDQRRRAGQTLSMIDGLPISIKDIFDVAGQTTCAGSMVLRDTPVARRTAPVIRRLQDAGAVVIGRTNMTEFAYSGVGINPHYGTPLNPWDRGTGRIPGGSSSGAAVSVTDGMAIAGIGSDTGGSVRIPAALCGLTGFKPTARRIPREGVFPLSTHLDSIGPLAPSVMCCMVIDAILAGERSRAMPIPAQISGLRFAAPRTLVLDNMDAEVATAYVRALSSISAAGARVEEMDLPELLELATINARFSFPAIESWHDHQTRLQTQTAGYDPRVASRMAKGSQATLTDLLQLVRARHAWVDKIDRRLEGFDAMLMPTVPVIAPALGPLLESDEQFGTINLLLLRNPTVINFLDGCALSLPCHRPGDAPVGLMVAGRTNSDASILSIGLGLESVLRANQR